MPELENNDNAPKRQGTHANKIEHFVLEARIFVELDGPGNHSDAVKRVEDRIASILYEDIPLHNMPTPKISKITLEEVRARKS